MSEYISIDFSKQGLWLEMAIDDLGNPRHWMTIDGEEIELTKKQYRVLMEQRVEAHKASTEAEQERIIKLLEDEELHTHPNNTMANYDKLVWEGIKEQLIALIKGEQK